MSTRRITISVPDEIATKAAKATASGRADSISAYFVGLAAREPDWAEAQTILDDLIAEVGGLSPEDLAWAKKVLGSDEEHTA